jgi:hypothetical protein
MQITFSERELEDFLCTDKNLEKYLDLKFIARQVRIEPVGIIDILGYHKDSSTWVIIELKKGGLDPNSFCQISSYINFYKKTKSSVEIENFRRERKFCGLLIGNSLDGNLHKCVSHYSNDGGWIGESQVNYCLFKLSFSGLDFGYHNKSQKSIEDKLINLCDHNETARLEKYYPKLTQ